MNLRVSALGQEGRQLRNARKVVPCPCPTSLSPLQSARTCCLCRAPLLCLRPRRNVLPPARRSTAPSIIRPTSLLPPASMPAPATSPTCSTASATACRFCRPPTPASPRCPAWSIPPSRSPTRCCSSLLVIPPSRRLPRQPTFLSALPRPIWLTAPPSRAVRLLHSPRAGISRRSPSLSAPLSRLLN